MTSNLSDEDFLQVFDEMSRICGDSGSIQTEVDINGDEFRLDGANGEDDDFLNPRHNFNGPPALMSSRAPLIGDQLLSSTSSRITKRAMTEQQSDSKEDEDDPKEQQPPRKRSRNSSANSGMSYDSAIGDIYFAGTPHSALDLERELLELTSASCEAAAAALSGAVSPDDGSERQISQNHCEDSSGYGIVMGDITDENSPSSSTSSHNKSQYEENAAQFEDAAAKDEDLQFVFQDFPSPLPPPPQQQPRPLQQPVYTLRQQQQQQQPQQQQQRLQQPLPSPRPTASENRAMWQHDIEVLCMDLLQRYRHAACLHPPQRVSLLSQNGEDPLNVTTRLLTDSLVRLRIFLYSLESVHWLSIADRNALYNAHVCSLAILKASVGVKMELVPLAYPLPYGENLSEVEALHLILAHDLFNELRSLLAIIKNLDIHDFSAMLMVMMVTFFTPTSTIQQPQKVTKAHDYYMHKLQIYLMLRYGPGAMPTVMTSILSTVGRVRNFSDRLREFMCDVTRCGLQKQFESVCENIGLIGFLLHSEPSLDR